MFTSWEESANGEAGFFHRDFASILQHVSCRNCLGSKSCKNKLSLKSNLQRPRHLKIEIRMKIEQTMSVLG